MMRRAPRWLVAICLIASAAGAGEEPRTALPEVVVTATRTRTRAENAAAFVTVIGSDDIEQRGHATVADALRGTPGVDLTEFGSSGHGALASIRGAAPDQVLVLLDGVEVNTPTVGLFDFADLPSDNLDHIEVVRGAGGSLYGPEAIGGVVNVLSRRGEGPLRLSVSGEAGSAGTHRELVGVSGAQGPLALSGTTSFSASDGFRSINDDYRNFSTVWRADADVLPAATLRGFLRYTNARAGLANFRVAEGRLDPDARRRSDFLLGKAEWEHGVAEGLTYRLAASLVRDNARFRDDAIDNEGEVEPEIIARSPSEILTAETQLDYLWREIALTTVGLEGKERSARVDTLEVEEEDGKTEQEVERFNANRSSLGVYVQEQLRLLDDTLRTVGGLRYDSHDGFGDRVTWSGSGSYQIRPTGTRLRVGYAEGFRAPTFDELFEPLLGNPDLEAETSWEVSAGATQELFDGQLRFEPTYFYREVANLIEEVADLLPGPVASVPESEGSRNVSTARLQGVELIARLQPTRWLTLSGNYAYLDFATPTGVLLNRPRHRGSFAVSSERSGLLATGDRATLSMLVYAVGGRDSADPSRDFKAAGIGGYGRVDLALAYRLAGRWSPLTLTARARNLFNRDYAESIGFPAPPARFLVGLRCELG